MCLEIIATHLDESWTHHLQLGLAKVLKVLDSNLMVGLTRIFKNVFWTREIKFPLILYTQELKMRFSYIFR